MNGKPPDTPIDRARQFAALSGLFLPKEALAAAGLAGAPAQAVAEVASALSRCCDTDAAPGRWLMRTSERRGLLQTLRNDHDLAAVMAARATRMPDAAAQDLLDALQGRGLFEPKRLAELTRQGPELAERRPDLERAATALGRLGVELCTFAGAAGHIAKVNIALGHLDQEASRQAAAAEPFVDREDELKHLAKWLAAPVSDAPVRVLLVTGPGGIGKSTLLARALEAAQHGKARPVVVKLDFDRPSLDILDPIGLTLEVARQVGAQLPQTAAGLRAARVSASAQRRDQITRGERPDSLPEAVAAPLRNAIAKAKGKRPTLIALDTLEVVRARGASHPERLLAWLDSLPGLGLAPLAVVAASRVDIYPKAADGSVEKYTLPPLPASASEALMGQLSPGRAPVKALGAAPAGEDMMSGFAGNPLAMRVVAEVAAGRSGSEGDADGWRAVATALIDRIVLSRLTDPDLRRLVRPGLVVRWITPALVTEALAPALGVTLAGPEEAERLVGELSRQQWLCETITPEPGKGSAWIRVREEIRLQIQPLLYAEDPEACFRVNKAAAAWFERRPEPWIKVEAAYHRLQMMRGGAAAPALKPRTAARLGTATAAELSPEARAVVEPMSPMTRSADEITEQKWRDTEIRAVDHSGATDLRTYMEKGDWAEAALIYDREFKGRDLDPASSAADAARTFLWRVGRWTEAGELMHAGEAPDRPNAVRLLDLVAWLELRAEYDFSGLAAELRQAAEGRSAAPAPAGRDDDLLAALARIPLYGTGLDLTSGALGFCCEAAGVARPAITTQRADPVGAALDLWRPPPGGGGGTARLLQAVSAANEQLTAHGFACLSAGRKGQRDTAACARALAALTPYGATLQRYEQYARDNKLAARAGQDFTTLRDGVAPYFGLAAPAGPGRATDDPLAALREVGMLAEWIGAVPEALPQWEAGADTDASDDDLARMAEAAERFRATVAGHWSYAAGPPAGWEPFAAGDGDVLQAQTAALLAKPPAGAAQQDHGLAPGSSDPTRWGRVFERIRQAGFAGAMATDATAASPDHSHDLGFDEEGG